MTDERERERGVGTSIVEWIVGGLGVLILLGVCAALGWDVLQGDDQPPAFAIAVIGEEQVTGGHLVRFRVENVGGRSAEQVSVSGRLAGQQPETASVVLDFLASGEAREGGFLFQTAPAEGELILRVESFAEP